MEKYENETGNLAIWNGEVSKDFRKWKKNKKKEQKKKEKKQELLSSKKEKSKLDEKYEQGQKAGKDYDHLIVVEQLHKTYLLGTTAVAALRGVDLTINRGDFVSIMGPSGSGKTTLLNLIGGLDTPTRGKIFLEGQNISMLSDNDLADIRRDRIGFVFQFYNLLPQMTALENVMVPLHFSGKLSRRGKKKRAMDLLSLVGLEERAHHTPSELSGGEQQRVAIARAFANDPAIVILDEPTGDLDSKTGILILNLLRDLNERGATFVAVSHDAAVSEFASRTLHMRDGKLTHEGKVGGLKETEMMEFKRKKEAEINKEKCKSKVFQFLFKNQGRQEIPISEIRDYLPEHILNNLPEHLNDILREIVEDNNIKGKIIDNTIILD
ncbi:MAG: ATP-binding cassette domain-containing protein [Candidatus Lokiarchaeota archaeon]|nr:ATP-binding cassette domain-containing protein [Candidatus Lokiarchaeota archaeon]MBD3200836.1 ATP-binding cassette domain-containing protein [Candidatus Lokiarchaeota archaeon]